MTHKSPDEIKAEIAKLQQELEKAEDDVISQFLEDVKTHGIVRFSLCGGGDGFYIFDARIEETTSPYGKKETLYHIYGKNVIGSRACPPYINDYGNSYLAASNLREYIKSKDIEVVKNGKGVIKEMEAGFKEYNSNVQLCEGIIGSLSHAKVDIKALSKLSNKEIIKTVVETFNGALFRYKDNVGGNSYILYRVADMHDGSYVVGTVHIRSDNGRDLPLIEDGKYYCVRLYPDKYSRTPKDLITTLKHSLRYIESVDGHELAKRIRGIVKTNIAKEVSVRETIMGRFGGNNG